MRVIVGTDRVGVLLLAAASAVAGWLLTPSPRFSGSASADDAAQAQCGHWCAYRCCQLLGVPVSLGDLIALMPAEEGGHTLLDLKRLLEQVGFECQGRRRNLTDLDSGPFPCVAHLTRPEHFVVVSEVDRDKIHVFDGAGRRTIVRLEEFAKRWSGVVLAVHRPSGDGPLPPNAQMPAGAPRIDFERLIVDEGAAIGDGGQLEFVYPFKNIGSGRLVIRKVSTTCACLDSKYPTEAISPGRTGEIRLVYDKAVQSGGFLEDAAVETNDPIFPVVALSAAGFVDESVRVAPARVILDRVPVGQVRRVMLFVRYSGERDDFALVPTQPALEAMRVQVYGPEDQLPTSLVEAPLADGDLPPSVRLVELLFQPTQNMIGRHDAVVVLTTNVAGFENLSIPLTLEVVPEVIAIPSLLSFGEVGRDEIAREQVKLVSRTDEPFRIQKVEVEGLPEALEITYDGSRAALGALVEFRARAGELEAVSGHNVAVTVEGVHSGERVGLSIPIYGLMREE